jgi:hypothetical protein
MASNALATKVTIGENTIQTASKIALLRFLLTFEVETELSFHTGDGVPGEPGLNSIANWTCIQTTGVTECQFVTSRPALSSNLDSEFLEK